MIMVAKVEFKQDISSKGTHDNRAAEMLLNSVTSVPTSIVCGIACDDNEPTESTHMEKVPQSNTLETSHDAPQGEMPELRQLLESMIISKEKVKMENEVLLFELHERSKEVAKLKEYAVAVNANRAKDMSSMEAKLKSQTKEIEKLTKERSINHAQILDLKRELSCVTSSKAKVNWKKTTLRSEIRTQGIAVRNNSAKVESLEKRKIYLERQIAQVVVDAKKALSEGGLQEIWRGIVGNVVKMLSRAGYDRIPTNSSV